MGKNREQDLAARNYENCRVNATSYENGIVFMPIIYGCRIGISIMKKDNGGISVKTYLDSSFAEIMQNDKEIKVAEVVVPGLQFQLIGFINIVVLALILRKDFSFIIALTALLFAIPKIVLLSTLVYRVKISGKLKKMGRYHAAEHMAINGYRKLKRAPKNIDELKKFSRFSKTCGVKEDIKPMVVELLLFATILLTQDLMLSILITALLSIIIINMITAGTFRFLQILVTNKPTSEEMLLALQGISLVEEYVNSARFKNVDGANYLYIKKTIE